MISRHKHIVLDQDYIDYKTVLKLKIINGFSSKSLKKSLTIEENNWIPDPDDVVYFLSGCSVPRFKLKDRFKVTNKVSKATVMFVNENMIEDNPNIIIHKYYYDVVDYYENYFSNHQSKTIKDAAKELNKLYDILLNCYSDGHELNTYYKNQKVLFNSIIKNYDTIYISEKVRADYWYENYGTYANEVKLNHVDFANPWSLKYHNQKTKMSKMLFEIPRDSDLFNFTGKIYCQNEMLKEINKGNFIIDFNKYKEFVTMANAGDENLLLCMELMANSDFEKSMPYLMFLFSEFYYEIGNAAENKHVNFRSLINFLYLREPKNFGLSVNDGIEMLKRHNKFTPANIAMWNELKASNSIKEEIII